MAWLNHGETTSLPTWMRKVQVLEPIFFSPASNLTLDTHSGFNNLVIVLLYNQITRINVHSSPLSRHDGSQSPRANTNFESLTSHVCLLAAGSILPGSLPMIRPKLITKCAATEKVQPVQKHFHSARQASTTRCITEAGFRNKTEPVRLLWGSGSEFVGKKQPFVHLAGSERTCRGQDCSLRAYAFSP